MSASLRSCLERRTWLRSAKALLILFVLGLDSFSARLSRPSPRKSCWPLQAWHWRASEVSELWARSGCLYFLQSTKGREMSYPIYAMVLRAMSADLRDARGPTSDAVLTIS
jgi:hypothetical protein